MGLINDKIAIISGRYELLHPGHIHTIRRFAKKYRMLYVYIVDNPENAYPSKWTRQLIDYCTIDLEGVVTKLDQCHFGYATDDDIDRLPRYDDFLCGNPDVAAHLRSLGVNVVEFEQSASYSSTDLKEGMLRQMVEQWREGIGK